MNHWIFQGNPDKFDIDTYLSESTHIIWSVRQHQYAGQISMGDEVFIWRSAGSTKKPAGIIAKGIITDTPTEMEDDAISKGLWTQSIEGNIELRVPIHILEKCLGAKEIVRRDWLKDDPIASNLRILKMAAETNYLIGSNEAQRLANLVRNTGQDWNRAESIAGLLAYATTRENSVSRKIGSPVADVALIIGRAVTGVYNKVMNFRSIDPTDHRKGLSAGGEIDRKVWAEFFDPETYSIDFDKLEQEYVRLWGKGKMKPIQKPKYKYFGDAPDDDPEELQQFATRVRRGQTKFRDNLMRAYGGKCVISGHGPQEVLEAVHIVPHSITGINKMDNGLLMRSDLHSLFDAGLLRIKPKTYTVHIDKTLNETPYYQWNGVQIASRTDGSQINDEFLSERWNQG